MSPQAGPPTTARIFAIAFALGALSFGGGLSAWMYREFVTKNGWLSETDFLSDMATARIMPGSTAVNIIILLGYRFLGIRGSIAGLVGLLIGPFCILAGIFFAYDFIKGPGLDAALQGAAAAAIGPLAYLAFKSIQHGGRSWYGMLVLTGTAAAAILKVPLVLTLCAGLCVSLLLVSLFWRA